MMRTPGRVAGIERKRTRQEAAREARRAPTRAELERLRASEERLRVAIETAGVGVWDYDPEARVLVWNPRCCELFGVPPDAPMDLETYRRSIHPDDRDAVIRETDRAMRPGSGGQLRIEHRTAPSPGRCARWLSAHGRVFFEGGRAVRFIGTIVDVTEPRRDKGALTLLAAAGEALAEPIDYPARAEATARLAIRELADYCMVEILEGGDRLKLAAVAHVDPAREELIREIRRRYPPDQDRHPTLAVIRSGEPELLEVDMAELERYAHDAEHLRMIQQVFPGSRIIVPLIARGTTRGALKLGRGPSRQPFDHADLRVAHELAQRAATALDNASLLEEAEVARRWLTRLQTVTARVAEALTMDRVLEVTFEQTYAALEAMGGGLYRVSEQRDALELVRAVGKHADVADDWLRIPLDLPVPITDAVKTARPVFGSAESLAARYPRAAGIFGPDVRARAAIPIVVGDRAIAAVVLIFPYARVFTADDEALLVAIVQLSATALERARLFDAEARARAAAEAANRAKDEFLAVVSHELRTPLAAIVGWTRLLTEGKVAPEKQARALDTIGRNARTQAQLIEDLLDLGRITSNKVRLDLAPVDLADVAGLALETVRPTADAKGVRIEADIDQGAGKIQGDAGRLQQIAWNLLVNAVKFTPAGGQVTLALRREGAFILLAVSDTGTGIVADLLPFVFDRFRQAESAQTRAHGGLGLGLAIVRHLVELHGGRIEAHSDGLGCGARFDAWFPAAAPGERLAGGDGTGGQS